MSKLFTEVNARLHENDPYRKFTIDCNKIQFFKENNSGLTTVFFNEFYIEVEMNYYEFQKNVMGEILKVEHQTDILQLMAGYLANNLVCNIPPETLIKDCKGIIQKIASENNSI
jgi:hypothetical protein